MAGRFPLIGAAVGRLCPLQIAAPLEQNPQYVRGADVSPLVGAPAGRLCPLQVAVLLEQKRQVEGGIGVVPMC